MRVEGVMYKISVIIVVLFILSFSMSAFCDVKVQNENLKEIEKVTGGDDKKKVIDGVDKKKVTDGVDKKAVDGVDKESVELEVLSNPVQVNVVARTESPFRHSFLMNFHFVHVLSAIIDKFADVHKNTSESKANLGVGVDYIMDYKGKLEFRASLYWSDFSMIPGYWLVDLKAVDKSPEGNVYRSANWVKNELSVFSLDLGVYGVVDILDNFRFIYGGGLWGGFVLGDVERYPINSPCTVEMSRRGEDPLSCPYLPFGIKEKRIPKFVGMASILLGLQYVLKEHYVFRTEFGFKGSIFGSLAAGVRF